MFGLTRNSGAAEIARAALEAVGYQTRDLLEAMRADWPAAGADTVLRVDGGMTASDVTMQFLADILAAPVDRPAVHGDDRARRGLSRRHARPASAPIRRASPQPGGSTAASSREWTSATRERKWAAGRPRSPRVRAAPR